MKLHEKVARHGGTSVEQSEYVELQDDIAHMNDQQLGEYWASLDGLQRRNFLFVVFTVCGQEMALHVLTKTAVADIVADETKGLRADRAALAKERDGMADAFTAYLDMQKRVDLTEQNLRTEQLENSRLSEEVERLQARVDKLETLRNHVQNMNAAMKWAFRLADDLEEHTDD